LKGIVMGYTHSFLFNKPKGVKAAVLEANYQTAILECARVAHAYNRECEAKGLDWQRLSGYTAHTPIGAYGGLQINGKGSEVHEPLELREHFSQNLEAYGADFVKTERKAYDTVVVACLAILKYRLGDAFEVISDGKAKDWHAGVALAKRVTRRAIKNPIK